jgi:hypothetical protein
VGGKLIGHIAPTQSKSIFLILSHPFAIHQEMLTCLAHQSATHRSPPLAIALPAKSSGTPVASDQSASLAKSAEYYSRRMDWTDRRPS